MTGEDSSVERVAGLVMPIAFWLSFASLGAGMLLWLFAAGPADAAMLSLSAGLLGLLTVPVLRLFTALATSVVHRDWLTLATTLAVLLILAALTLREAAAH